MGDRGHDGAEPRPPEAAEPPAAVERPLLDVADDSLEAYFRLLATTAAGGEVEEGPGYLFFAGAHEYPGTYTNGAIRTGSDPAGQVTPHELLARADAFFGRHERPYVVWVRTHLDADLDSELQRRGLFVRPPVDGSEAVLLRNREFELGPTPEGVDIFETTDEDVRREFLLLVTNCYGLPEADLDLAERVMFSMDSLRDPDNHLYVARRHDNGRLCGGLTTYVAEGVGHNAWSVTDPIMRGRGIGRAVTMFSAKRSFEAGADFVWGVASQMGGPVWRTVGFETVTRHKRYVMPKPDALPASSGPPVRRRRSPAGTGSEA